ncbi:hypothetical protein ACLBQC_32435, partial [Klebsiella pneumoniae]|uniref:hypothetical protein n=1 Tax=Klebsiella pneumoniae TaxID=573 RepID=UPI0039686496
NSEYSKLTEGSRQPLVHALIEVYDDDSLADVLNKSPDDIIILFSKHATNAYQHYKVLRQNINAKIGE